MQKRLTFLVTLSFEGSVETDEEIMEVTNNIANSLKHTADTAGLAPEQSDTFTTTIEVREGFLQEPVTIHL